MAIHLLLLKIGFFLGLGVAAWLPGKILTALVRAALRAILLEEGYPGKKKEMTSVWFDTKKKQWVFGEGYRGLESEVELHYRKHIDASLELCLKFLLGALFAYLYLRAVPFPR